MKLPNAHKRLFLLFCIFFGGAALAFPVSFQNGREFQETILSLVAQSGPKPADEVLLTDYGRVKSVSWFGYLHDDATDQVQAAIDSDCDIVVFTATEGPWIVRPIKLRSNKTIVFAPGTVVKAKRGEFKGRSECLFSVDNGENITLLGYGARMEMWQDDYKTAAYERSEWRNILQFRGCSGIHVEGLEIARSGGDGIYIGATSNKQLCTDVRIQNVRLIENHRQGITVIAAKGLLIDGCVIHTTRGTAPQAGIDFEPNRSTWGFDDCVVSNTEFHANAGGNVVISIGNAPLINNVIDITIDNCRFSGSSRDVRIRLKYPDLSGTILLDRNLFAGAFLVENDSSVVVSNSGTKVK